MIPVKSNLLFAQGANVEITFQMGYSNGQVYDFSTFTNSSGAMQLVGNTSVTSEIDVLLMSNGYISVSFGSEQTSNLMSGTYLYNVYVSNSETRYRVLEGTIDVTKEIKL